jgi:hypothetical protein
MAMLGAEKKRSEHSSTPAVRVVYEKSEKPEPLVCRPGGETKMLTSSSTHQMKVMARKVTEMKRKARTVQRL